MHSSLQHKFENLIKMLLCKTPSKKPGKQACVWVHRSPCLHTPLNILSAVTCKCHYPFCPLLYWKHWIKASDLLIFLTHLGCHRWYSLPDCRNCSPAWIMPDCLFCIWGQWGCTWLSKNSSPSGLTARSTTAEWLAGLAWERFGITVFMLILLMQNSPSVGFISPNLIYFKGSHLSTEVS